MFYGKRPRGKGIFKKGETEMSFKELLKSKDMTAARLSRKIGVTRWTVCNWVNGRNTPQNVLTVGKIAKALETDFETILNCFKKAENK